jgi:PIN like domain
VKRLRVALDCDVPDRLAPVLNSLYGDKGFEFFPVTAFAAANSSDDHWADAFKRFGGHITLSGDAQIAYKPHKVLSFIDNGFMSFFFASPWHRSPGYVKAAHTIYWWPTIAQKAAAGETGRCWRVPCDLKNAADRFTDLRLVPGELEALVIPDHVLQEARVKRRESETTAPAKRKRRASAAVTTNGRQGGLGI